MTGIRRMRLSSPTICRPNRFDQDARHEQQQQRQDDAEPGCNGRRAPPGATAAGSAATGRGCRTEADHPHGDHDREPDQKPRDQVIAETPRATEAGSSVCVSSSGRSLVTPAPQRPRRPPLARGARASSVRSISIAQQWRRPAGAAAAPPLPVARKRRSSRNRPSLPAWRLPWARPRTRPPTTRTVGLRFVLVSLLVEVALRFLVRLEVGLVPAAAGQPETHADTRRLSDLRPHSDTGGAGDRSFCSASW